jgi:predicted Zn-dependent peptidase
MLTPRILVLFLLLFLCNSAFTQQKNVWKEATSSGYKYRYVSNDPMKARFYTLKNGLTVMLSPNPKEPRIQTLIAVRAGSNSDPREHTGLAHYLEHLLFKGTYLYGSIDSTKEKAYLEQIDELYDSYNKSTDQEQRKLIYRKIDSVSGLAAKFAIANEYDKMMTSMGAQGTNAHTSVEETVYEEDIPSNVIDKFLAVQAERFRNPVFRLFHTELEAVYEEKNRGLDSDGNKVWEASLSALFPKHNYGQQTTIGTIEHLKNPSLKAIREFYEKQYVPGNMAIIMAGDFNPDEVIAKIDKAFSFMKGNTVEEYNGPKEEPLTAPVVKEVVGPDAEYLQMLYRLPGIQDYNSTVVATVVSQLLANGKAGLLDINLNKQQKVLSSAAGVETWKDYSMFILNGKARDGQSLEQVRDLLLSQIELLRKGDFDESMVKAIVSNFKLYELQGLESNANRADAMMNSFILHRGADWDKDVAFIEQMSKVTKQQIVDFANTYLKDNYVIVFKRKGENKNIQKVEKPPITPVAINRDTQSEFVKKIEAMPVSPIEPRWLNYEKEISRSKMGNADVLYVQNKDNDLFSLYYRFDMGSWNRKELGLAASYLQFLGDGKLSAEQISREFYNIACNFNVSPGTENTTISVSGLQENFDKAVKLLENLILNCKPDEAALKNLKARILKSRADAKLNKGNIAKGLNNYALYGAKNPFNYQLTTSELDAVTASQLTDLLHEIFDYKHTIIYYGPKPLPAFTASLKKLHTIPATFKQEPAAVKFERQAFDENKVFFTNYDMVQSEIYWIRNAGKYDTTLVPVIELYNSYFGGGMGSIVFQTIRESKALAYSTFSVYSSPDKADRPYIAVAYVGSQADKMNEAIAAMNELLNELPKTEEALMASKESIRQDIASQRITKEAIIFNYLSGKRLGLNSDFRKKVYETVPKLTFGDINKFHKENIANKAYAYCITASKDKIKTDDLNKIGKLQELTLEEIFGY